MVHPPGEIRPRGPAQREVPLEEVLLLVGLFVDQGWVG